MTLLTDDLHTIVGEAGTAIRDADIQELEAALSVRLPIDYRNFLLMTNGGLLRPNAIRLDTASWSPTDVYAIFGIGRVFDTSDLRWNMQSLHLPSTEQPLLPIACDTGGCPFCLVIDGKDAGWIVYIDLDNQDRHYRVAPSFSEFVANIDFDLPERRYSTRPAMQLAAIAV